MRGRYLQVAGKLFVIASLLSCNSGSEIQEDLPPQIAVLAPKDKVVTNHQAYMVQATAATESAPLTEFVITLNGKLVDRQVYDSNSENPTEMYSRIEVDLQPGLNSLSFEAKTARAVSSPKLRSITYEPLANAEGLDSRPSLAVLAIGIADYRDHRLRLAYPAEDARAISDLFAGQDGKAFSRVTIRTLTGTTLVDKRAILDGLAWLKTEAPGRNTMRLLFLAGHGRLDARENYYFLSQDHDLESDLDVHSTRWQVLIDRLTEGESTFILLVDSCHAGAILGNSNPIEQIGGARFGNLIAFGASAPDQLASGRSGHGIFTTAILKGLRDFAADGYGERPKDGKIEAGELRAYLDSQILHESGGRQRGTFHCPTRFDNLELFRSQP